MNNPFHRAALKAFTDVVWEVCKIGGATEADKQLVDKLAREFEERLEAAAHAFDSCKRGSEISMTTLAHEMLKAFYLAKARVKLDGDWNAAERVFRDHMKPHFEIRLW